MIRYKFLVMLSNLQKPERRIKQHISNIHQNILFSEDKMKTLLLICVSSAMTNAVPVVVNREIFSNITETERLGKVEEWEEENLIEDLMEEAKNCSDF